MARHFSRDRQTLPALPNAACIMDKLGLRRFPPFGGRARVSSMASRLANQAHPEDFRSFCYDDIPSTS
jgi:hypothetical protein